MGRPLFELNLLSVVDEPAKVELDKANVILTHKQYFLPSDRRLDNIPLLTARSRLGSKSTSYVDYTPNMSLTRLIFFL